MISKRIIAFVVFGLFIHTSLHAQVIMSLIFGDKLNNESNLFGIHVDVSSNHISDFEPSKSLSTFNLGLFFTHRWENSWELNVDMLAKYRRGAKGLSPYVLEDPTLTAQFAEADLERRINYLSVPVTFRYHVKNGFFGEFGPQISYRLKARDIFETTTPDGNLELEVDVRDQVQKFDFSLVFGLGTYLGKDQVNAFGIRYHAGLTDVMNQYEGNQKFGQWAVYANLPIGRGKAGL
ncbi:PorT family protein [Algoriphagus aestuarii]|nr:PorT family protein [Algoriphagus aestuarii]